MAKSINDFTPSYAHLINHVNGEKVDTVFNTRLQTIRLFNQIDAIRYPFVHCHIGQDECAIIEMPTGKTFIVNEDEAMAAGLSVPYLIEA